MGKRYRDIVRTSSRAKRSARAVLMLLADYADDDGLTWPGNVRIASECGLSERTVTRALAELIELGEIEIALSARQHSAPRYRITIQGGQIDYSKGRQTVTPETAQGRHPVMPRVDNLSARVDILSSQDSQNVYPDQRESDPDASAEPYEPDIKEPKRERKKDAMHPPVTPGKAPTPQQELFGAVCEATGWDPNTLSERDKGQVAQTCGILKRAGYGVVDVRRFMLEIWFHDWRWAKNQDRPTLNQLRQEIGKLRAGIPVDLPVNGNGPPGAARGALSKADQTMANFAEYRRLKAAGEA